MVVDIDSIDALSDAAMGDGEVAVEWSAAAAAVGPAEATSRGEE